MTSAPLPPSPGPTLPACPPMPPLYTHWAPPKQRDENGEGIKQQKSKWICCSVELLSMHVDHNPVGLLVRVIRRRDRESSIKAFSVTVGCTTLLLSGDAPSNPIPTWTNSLFSCLIFQRKVCRQLRLSLLCGLLAMLVNSSALHPPRLVGHSFKACKLVEVHRT